MTGQQVLDRWVAFIRQYAYLSHAQAVVVALWAMNTWVFETFAAVPFLEIVATGPNSGKTTILHLLKMLSRNAGNIRSTIRVLSIVRDIEAAEGRATILIDEAEQLESATLGDTRQTLASAYLEGSSHRVHIAGKPYDYRTFAPYAFAMIGNITAVLRTRCIELELERQEPERYLSEHREEAKAQADDCILAFDDYVRQHGRIPINAPTWLRTREREIWTPLISLAHYLRLHADTMRELEAFSVDNAMLKTQPPKKWHAVQDAAETEERDYASRVLADMQTVTQRGETFIPTGELIDRLRGISTGPWRAWRGAGLNEHVLGALLARYGVSSVIGQIGKGKTRKVIRGYKVADYAKLKP